MIARVGRLAGAILFECSGRYFLIGNTKGPCDWQRKGFQSPARIDANTCPVLPLESLMPVEIEFPRLFVEVSADQSAEDIATILAKRFLIARNASVSDRLWTLIVGEDENTELEATWLLDMPEHIWQVVRDTVLKCT